MANCEAEVGAAATAGALALAREGGTHRLVVDISEVAVDEIAHMIALGLDQGHAWGAIEEVGHPPVNDLGAIHARPPGHVRKAAAVMDPAPGLARHLEGSLHHPFDRLLKTDKWPIYVNLTHPSSHRPIKSTIRSRPRCLCHQCLRRLVNTTTISPLALEAFQYHHHPLSIKARGRHLLQTFQQA